MDLCGDKNIFSADRAHGVLNDFRIQEISCRAKYPGRNFISGGPLK
jgi:hypothetical protein